MGGTPFDDLCHIDAVISGDVLVPYAPRDAEAKTWMEGRTEVNVQVGWGAGVGAGDGRDGGGDTTGHYL